MNETYRLKVPTLAIQKGRRSEPVVIPSGATLNICGPGGHDKGNVVECMWSDCVVLVLALDLRERGERIEPGS